MHNQLKHAWFNLIILSTVFALVVVAYGTIFMLYGAKPALGALGFLGLLGIQAFGGLFYRKSGGIISMDERDKQIRDWADLAAWRVVWLYWLLACFIPWFWVVFRFGLESLSTVSVPVLLLPFTYIGAFFVHQTVWSLAIVWSYREVSQ